MLAVLTLELPFLVRALTEPTSRASPTPTTTPRICEARSKGTPPVLRTAPASGRRRAAVPAHSPAAAVPLAPDGVHPPWRPIISSASAQASRARGRRGFIRRLGGRSLSGGGRRLSRGAGLVRSAVVALRTGRSLLPPSG